jgi:hypothetical protein
MTERSLLGVALFNLFVLAVGVGLLWGVRGWRSWLELARLSGLAYMLGVAALGISFSLELIVGVPFSLPTILGTGMALAVGGVAAGIALGRPRPAWRTAETHGIGTLVALSVALVVVYMEALFRAARLQGLSAWDAWAFWVPKAKAIYFFGGLDAQFFSELPNSSYPPLLPALEASTFHFMGSPDVVSLHLQFSLFLCGFIAAIVGILSSRVSALVLWPLVLLVLVSPRIVLRPIDPQADFLLDYLFALAALLVALWLIEKAPWQLVSASIFLGAAMLTKREGWLLAACVLVAALAASFGNRRYAWPRLGLVGGAAVAVAIPWRIWFMSRGFPGDLPNLGPLDLFGHLNRVWPALDSVFSTIVAYDLWLIVLPLAGVAVVLAFLGGARTLATYAALVYLLAVAGFTWVLWSFTDLELPIVQDESVNPIVRLTGSLVVLSVALVPLLLDAAWHRDGALDGT